MDGATKKPGTGGLHMVKLCVGTDTVEELADWREEVRVKRLAAGLDPRIHHVTRMWPRRADELLDGGSLYWVVRGLILVRQKIDALEEAIGEDGIRRCAIVLSPDLIRTEPRPRRPFQGWRYLAGADVPPDLNPRAEAESELPAEMRMALLQLGIIGR